MTEHEVVDRWESRRIPVEHIHLGDEITLPPDERVWETVERIEILPDEARIDYAGQYPFRCSRPFLIQVRRKTSW